MKRLFNRLLVVCMLLALLPTAALATEGDPTDAGMYGITGSLTLTPQTAASEDITASTQGGHEGYYADAVRFGVSGADLTAGVQYLLLVIQGAKGTLPTESSIVYMDQEAADEEGKITFNAYPNRFADGHYCVYLVGAGKTFDAASPAAEFDYYQPYTLGDVDDSGQINSVDALMVLRYAVRKITLSDVQKLAANVNGDSEINSTDALMILQYAVGKITNFTGQ